MPRDDRPVSSRRSIIVAALGLVAGPAWAQEEPTAGDVRIPLASGDVPAYRAQPAGAGPFPCVLVAGDTPGTPAWIAEDCRRLAQAGYLAVAPDLWTAPVHADDDVLPVLDATAVWAGQNGGDPARIGMAGFGRGGRVAWLYAAQSASLKASVAWGGGVGGAASGPRSKTPLDVAGQLQAPLLGLYGKNDASNPRALLLRAESAAHAAGRTVELVAYVGAAADFAAEGRPSYDKAAEMDGWNRMLAWFKRYGVA